MAQQDEKAQSEKAGPVVTDELLADLDKNPHKMAELPKPLRNAVKARLLGQDGGEAAPTDEGAGGETPEPPTPKADEKPVAAKPGEEPPKRDVLKLRAELQEEADEANRLEQKIEAARKRREKADTTWKEIDKREPSKKPEDFLEDKHQETVLTRLDRLEKENEFLKTVVKDRDQEEIESLTQMKATKEENKFFSEVDLLQADDKFAAIRMKKSFREANSEYANWLDNLAALSGLKEADLTEDEKKNPKNALRARALSRYDEDPTFKASVKIQPPEELEKLSLILEAYGRKAGAGGTLKGHLFEILDEKGVLGKVVERGRQEAARDASNRTADAMRAKNEEITTIAPGDGSSKPVVTDGEFTPESAASFMALVRQKQSSGQRLSADEKKKLLKVREYAASLG